MTQNIVTFIGQKLKALIQENLGENGDIQRFWLQPCGTSEPTYLELVEEGKKVFEASTLDNYLDIDGVKTATIRDESRTLIMAYSTERLSQNLDSDDFGLVVADPHFLQLAKFAVEARVTFTQPIPLRVANEAIFNEDLLGYFPPIMCFTIPTSDAEEHPLISFVKVMLYIEQDKEFVRSLKDEFIDLARALPPDHHDWLFSQLYSVIRSRKIENVFLGLYKILEFFFPLQNVLELREKISFKDSNLSLVRHCVETLQWHIGHYKGAKSSVNFASCAFAEICLQNTFRVQRDQEDAESSSSEKERKFKTKAMDLLSTVRHDLTHQNFSYRAYDNEDMLRYSAALVVYLTEAFIKYEGLSSEGSGTKQADAPDLEAIA